MLAVGPPAGGGLSAWKAAAVVAWMAIWWMTEAIPLAVTALLPLVVLPLFGITTIDATASAYAQPLIFLFLGGFLLAKAMESWDLHRRLSRIAARIGGNRPRLIILNLMATTAFLSMWISNTATAMVMMPIALSLSRSLAPASGQGATATAAEHNDFAAALLLGIAFAATIGGMGTLIGTPPNALFAGLMQKSYGVSIGFAAWMAVGVPVVIVLLPVCWLILTRIVLRVPARLDVSVAAAADRMAPLPPMSTGERRVAVLLALTALAWISRPLVARLLPGLPLSDAGIAMLAAISLFVIPAGAGRGIALLDWEHAKGLRWDVLILVGGGLALADAIHTSGLANSVADSMTGLAGWPAPLIMLVLFIAIVYLGELASNTAIAAVFLPIAGATAVGMGLMPIALMMPVALAASLGFMLPVATPPNAIAYGTGEVSARQLLRAGALLDVVSIVIVAAIAQVLGPLVFTM
jgi:sodium-dependent dicarboxylate transporter 2/3/5